MRYCSSRRSRRRNFGARQLVTPTTPRVTQPPSTTAGTRPAGAPPTRRRTPPVLPPTHEKPLYSRHPPPPPLRRWPLPGGPRQAPPTPHATHREDRRVGKEGAVR